LLAGRQDAPTLALSNGFYTVTLPPASAALLTLANKR